MSDRPTPGYCFRSQTQLQGLIRQLVLEHQRGLSPLRKPASVKKHFERMNNKLHTELGIEPAEETKRLFAELIR